MDETNNKSLIRLRDAFASLLITRSINKITVQDVVRKAEINRSTFYRYFLDLNDFIDWLDSDMITEITNLVKLNDDQRIDFTEFYRYAIKNRSLLKGLLESKRWQDFVDHLFKIVSKNYVELLKKQSHSIPIEIQSQFFIGGNINLFKWWLSQSDQPSPEIMAKYHEMLSTPQ